MRMNYSEHFCSILAHALTERLALALDAAGVEMEEMEAACILPHQPDDTEYAICIADKNCHAQDFLQNLDSAMKQAEIKAGRTEEDSWAFVWERAENILNFMDVLEAIAAAPGQNNVCDKSPYPGDEAFLKALKENPVMLYFASNPHGYHSLQNVFNDIEAQKKKYDGNFFTFSLERLRTLAKREEYVSLPSDRLNALHPKKA